MTFRSPADAQLNADVTWAAFDPIAYVDHNYRDLQAEDAEILHIVRDHFGDHFREHTTGPVSGIDVGAGANLYPALSMLPWCDEITLFERSPSNVDYLKGQVESYDDNWDQFWRVLCKREAYGALDVDPRAKFRETVRVQQGNIFDLLHEGQWSMGTMFFVAESMTTCHEEFARGVECFLRALAPGAPFAAAFMEHSLGYHAGKHFFPACDVGESEVYKSLEPFAGEFETVRLKASAAVRDGYSGMIVAYGHRDSDSNIPAG
ncbi:methyltransferase [Streptomyces hygroscopicus]|uniref:SCO2525 family SAM-dependent methyltransferase n=1 Tax=Streptomyces hygroscopicus TaxID=1912 RepID=UPI002240AF28|nr:SCO2525 family SAM-dependent methyltransferase [Streptomyces hygroscopicus]MCW7943563.1 methyltransferase [Streptomyces hygroscopicus]